MKARIYLRIAKDPSRRISQYGPRVAATGTPSQVPLTNSDQEYLPTAAFALDLDIPDALFERASQVLATIEVPESEATVAAEVKYPSDTNREEATDA